MTMHCTENRLFQQVLGFMDARELGYEAQPGEDGGLLFFQANLDSGVYQMVLSVDGREGLNQLLLFAPVAVKPPAESRLAVLELLNSINFTELSTGCFEMDACDGEIRLRMGMALGGTPWTEDLFISMLSQAIVILDACVIRIMAVASGAGKVLKSTSIPGPFSEAPGSLQ